MLLLRFRNLLCFALLVLVAFLYLMNPIRNSQDQTQNNKEYVIVDFPEESKKGEICMALISNTWIFEEKGTLYCHWPSYLKSTLSREKVVKTHTPLQLQKCLKCVVLVKHTSDDYDKAAFKLKQLEDESEHSSAAEASEEQKIRKTNKSYKSYRQSDFLYSDGSSNDETFIPTAPKFPEDKKSGKSFNEIKTIKSHPDVRPLDINRFPEEKLNDDETRSMISFDKKCHCEKNTKMLERMLRDIQAIKLDVKTLMQDLNNTKLTEFQQLDGQLHFKEYNDIQSFNEKLAEEDYFNKMQASISLLGGRDLNDTTRKILSLLISQNLALIINWIGVNEKGSFQKLRNVLKLIYGAVRKNVSTSNATNTEIDTSIRSWIKNAPDRAGGRANRRKNK